MVCEGRHKGITGDGAVYCMKPQPKIIDAQALAKFVQDKQDTFGNVKVSDVLSWIIGANNRIEHKHARFVDKIGTLNGSDPEIITALVDRTEFLVLDGKTFRAKVAEFLAENLSGEAKP